MKISESFIIVSFIDSHGSELKHLLQKSFLELQRENPGFNPVFIKRTKVNLPKWAIGKSTLKQFGEILLGQLQVNH
jgi:hypothetical protein